MNQTPKQITRALDRVLHKVERPGRYTGGELNSISKVYLTPMSRPQSDKNKQRVQQ